MAKRKWYGKEFKLEAARLFVEYSYTFKEAGKRLGPTGEQGLDYLETCGWQIQRDRV